MNESGLHKVVSQPTIVVAKAQIDTNNPIVVWKLVVSCRCIYEYSRQLRVQLST